MPIWTTIIARVMFCSCIFWQYILIVFMPTFGSSVKWTNAEQALKESCGLNLSHSKLSKGNTAIKNTDLYLRTYQERKQTSDRWDHRCEPPTQWGLSAWGDPRWACLQTDPWNHPAFGPTRLALPGILCRGKAEFVKKMDVSIHYRWFRPHHFLESTHSNNSSGGHFLFTDSLRN